VFATRGSVAVKDRDWLDVFKVVAVVVVVCCYGMKHGVAGWLHRLRAEITLETTTRALFNPLITSILPHLC